MVKLDADSYRELLPDADRDVAAVLFWECWGGSVSKNSKSPQLMMSYEEFDEFNLDPVICGASCF